MKIAVTGSTGTIGGLVVRLLAAGTEHEVVALSRRPAGFGSRVANAHADYDDLDSLRTALRGVDTLVFVSSDGEAARMMVHHRNVVTAAVDNAVSHVVYLSGLDADLDSPFCYAHTNGYTEHLLTESGCGHSFARASIFTEFFLGFADRARAGGELRVPAAEGRISLVSRADVARCLAALALSPATGRAHDLTGPESLDLNTVAERAATRWDTPLRYTDVAPETFGAELAAGGEDAWWTYAYSTMLASIREHRWTSVSDEVHRLTGRGPESVDEVLGRADS